MRTNEQKSKSGWTAGAAVFFLMLTLVAASGSAMASASPLAQHRADSAAAASASGAGETPDSAEEGTHPLREFVRVGR